MQWILNPLHVIIKFVVNKKGALSNEKYRIENGKLFIIHYQL